MTKLDTKQNFSIPSSDSDRDKIILLAVKVLAEKEGGNITLNQLLAKIDNLTYEEIMATTDLSGKVSSASALKTVFNTYKIKEISSSSSYLLELNNCTDLYTCYIWDYAGSAYVTCGGVAISTSAGSVINFPKFAGVLQLFINYNSPSMKVRTLYNNSWSKWYSITTSESSL